MLSDTNAIQSAVATIIEEMIGELDLDYDQPIESRHPLDCRSWFCVGGLRPSHRPSGDSLSSAKWVFTILSCLTEATLMTSASASLSISSSHPAANGNNASATRAKVLDDRSPPIAAHAEASSGRSRRILRGYAFSGKMGRTGERLRRGPILGWLLCSPLRARAPRYSG